MTEDELDDAQELEEDELIEGTLNRKKKGRRVGGKYKSRGKHKDKDY